MESIISSKTINIRQALDISGGTYDKKKVPKMFRKMKKTKNINPVKDVKQAPPTDVTPYEQNDTISLNTDISPVHLENYEFNCQIIQKYLLQFTKCKVIYQDPSIQILLKIIRRKIPDKKKYFQRLTKELGLIIQFQFERVFFQVHQILEIAGEIPHIIRGSAGSCLLCFLMKITDIDPIVEKISLSRFMHQERMSIPDIDIDFPSHLRDQIYLKIFKKWKNQVARISNHIMYQEKSAYREAIRQAGHRKFIPREYELEDIFTGKDQKQKITQVKKNVLNLMGKFRCYSLHCGGIVIFPKDVPTNLYLQDFEIGKTGKNGKQIWMNKDQVEDANMIKIDILSNRGLSQLMDISPTPLFEYDWKDKKTWILLNQGLNLGITHSESRAMYKVFRIMQPQSIKEVAIALALIRPAAAKNYRKSDFLKDYTPYKYDKKNHIIFDDDATQFIKKLLGCDSSEADNFRRGFSKSKLAIINHFKEILPRFEKNVSRREEILSRLEQLSYYSFCKSHAYSYAQLVFALAYQKAHHPIKFWLASLNHCNSSYRKWVHFREARKAGIRIRFGKRPYTLGEKNVLIATKPQAILYKDKIKQFIHHGYWLGKGFLPGMYYQEYWTPVTKKHTQLDKCILENGKMKYAKFRGIIATGRGYKKEQGKGYITFVTLGSNNGVYHDLVLYGYHKVSRMICLEGYGKLKTDGFVTWIEALQWKTVWLKDDTKFDFEAH